MINLRTLGLLALAILVLVDPALAADAAAAEGGSGGVLVGLGAAIGIGVAAFGGAFGQSKVASSALDGIARNPGASGQMFLPMILGLVFIETLVLMVFALPIGLKLFGIF